MRGKGERGEGDDKRNRDEQVCERGNGEKEEYIVNDLQSLIQNNNQRLLQSINGLIRRGNRRGKK